MKEILTQLFEHRNLGRNEAREVLHKLANGEYNEAETAAFMTVFMMRSISIDEMAGFRDALLEMRTAVDLSHYNPIDIVGTGGDGKNTFNISTAACFVVAGAGYKVCKQGNYGSTSVCGASNVMEAHGVRFTTDPETLYRSIEKSNMAYLHAQYFHPALKTVAPIRKALRVPTFFNLLGPLVNPMRPQRQVLGVYNLKMARLYTYLYQQESIDFAVVHALDGYDEVSLTGPFKLFNTEGERLYTPQELGLNPATAADLWGGNSIQEAAALFDKALQNKASRAQIDCVAANAAVAICTIHKQRSLQEAIEEARESIVSKRAWNAFQTFVALNQ